MSTIQFRLHRKQQQQQYPLMNLKDCRPIINSIVIWIIHFAISTAVLAVGAITNHGERKYVPIDVEKIKDDECYRGFVNVFSLSRDSPDAILCCNPEGINPGICEPPPSYLLFSKRLTRFPDAWLLPLFPLLLRIVLQIYRGGCYSEERSEDTNTKRRLYLYILLIQLRGWILYKLFDTVEDMIVSPGGTDCWYSELLMFHDSECRGRETDFSDHVVLYYAQIIPIALTEFLHSFSVPYWKIKNPLRDDDTSFPKLIPFVLIFWMVNLYIITCFGAYKTSMYFHTGPEVFVGYLVSLLVQIPLLLLQCTSVFPRARAYFFGYAKS